MSSTSTGTNAFAMAVVVNESNLELPSLEGDDGISEDMSTLECLRRNQAESEADRFTLQEVWMSPPVSTRPNIHAWEEVSTEVGPFPRQLPTTESVSRGEPIEWPRLLVW